MKKYEFPDLEALTAVCEGCREFGEDGLCVMSGECPVRWDEPYCRVTDTEYMRKGRLRKADSVFRRLGGQLNKGIEKGLFAGVFELPAFTDKFAYVFSKDHGMMFDVIEGKYDDTADHGSMEKYAVLCRLMTEAVNGSITDETRTDAVKAGMHEVLPFSVTDDGLNIESKNRTYVMEIRAWGRLSRTYPWYIAVSIQKMMGALLCEALNRFNGEKDESDKKD